MVGASNLVFSCFFLVPSMVWAHGSQCVGSQCQDAVEHSSALLQQKADMSSFRESKQSAQTSCNKDTGRSCSQDSDCDPSMFGPGAVACISDTCQCSGALDCVYFHFLHPNASSSSFGLNHPYCYNSQDHSGRGGKPDRRGLSSKQGPLVKLGISQFLEIQDEWVQLNCEEGRTLADVTASMWVPGCELKTKRQICTAPCYDVRLLEDAVNFNTENPGDVVHYPSRRGIGHDGVPIESITLGGWWLPAPPRFGSSTPRIVLQHGFTAHSNDHTVLGVSYMLRSIGYSVLINNFRDHCYSENSTARSSEWGHAYPYDLLGAWDYAQTDPDGILGGTYPASKVGVLGFSMGGFAAVNAFGLEQAIPAIWVDAPAFTPKASFENFFPSLRPGIILDKVIDHVWKGIESESLSRGIDLNENLPSVVLEEVAATQAPRPVYVVNNKDDKKVLPSEIELLVELLNKYPTKFELSRYEVEGRCHGNNHCDMHWSHHEQYLDRLCNFWTSVFSQDQSYCGL